MNPVEILKRVGERYAECRSYSDSGIAEFDTIHRGRDSIEFKTDFIRPDYLCFSWQDYGPRRGKSERPSMVWANGDRIIRRRDTSKVTVEEETSLGLAMAGATGCSAGAAHHIPALLIDELRAKSRHLLLLTDLELIDEQLLDDNQNCFVLKGSLFKPGDHNLWVSTNDFGVRRIRIDQSATADEVARDIKIILADTELMDKLAEKGLAPPKQFNPKDPSDLRMVTEYTYKDVSFDGSIVREPQPVI